MKNFTAREKRIISAAYRDCERICAERWSEQTRGEPKIPGIKMAGHLAHLCHLRGEQIIKYKLRIPYRTPKWIRNGRKAMNRY